MESEGQKFVPRDIDMEKRFSDNVSDAAGERLVGFDKLPPVEDKENTFTTAKEAIDFLKKEGKKTKKIYIVDGKEIEVDEEKGETLEQKLIELGETEGSVVIEKEPGWEDKKRRLVIEKDEF